MADGRRGSKRLGTRDWIFGSAPRRDLLAVVLLGPAPDEGWTKADLARSAGLSPKGGVDEHVAGFATLGLLEARDGRWFPGRPSGLARALRALLRELEAL
ncbi:MAG: hypothetical protein JWM73_304 [Solirubrobacterales bacterium]|jgi:hypothetical protein|nr:hypothetical protein [Solirubrobacterales bacterium]